ncbi:MAG: hypothetical protein FWD56_02590 [Bacteroidales bacterium]|nr:hypothetical protein [Bacteroidales bacterium]
MKQAFYFLLLSAFFACCTPMDRMDPIDYTVLRYEAADFSSLSKFVPMLEDYGGMMFFLDKKLTFSVAVLEYTTVDPFGNPIQASGLVYHPLNKKSKGVIDMLPIARLDITAPSEDFFAAEGLSALVGYTLIIPDLLGFGKSDWIKPPFLLAENTGRVAFDMRRAAAQYLWDRFRYQLPAETTITGYSLGGSAALATQKYYETYHSNTVKVKEVYAGGGAYDLTAAFNAFAKTRFSDFAAIPHTIFAFDHYYDLDLDLTQIFKADPPLDRDSWYNGVYSTDKIEKIGTDIAGYMHEDFFKPFELQNGEFKKLHPFLVLNSVSEGWRPKAPIYLYHATTDTYVPRECAEAAITKLRKAGANISLISYPGDHFTVGYYFMYRLLIQLL